MVLSVMVMRRGLQHVGGVNAMRGSLRSVVTVTARNTALVPAAHQRTGRRNKAAPAAAMKTEPMKNDHILAPLDLFVDRHLGPSPADVQEMCKVTGVKDVDTLMSETIPDSVRRTTALNFHEESMSEALALKHLKEVVSKNVVGTNFIGQGYYGTLTPGVIHRSLFENPAWYTAYTPYQAEIAQGRMESLVNFQTLVCEITGMEAANASLLDEGTAAAEAMAMIARTVNAKKKNMFFVSDQCHPQTIDCIQTRAEFYGINVIVGDHKNFDFSKEQLSGALVQYPDTQGTFHDYSDVAKAVHGHGAQLVVAADPLGLMIAKPPAEFGADIVVGNMQRFGVPMLFGGPSAAYFACSKKQVRRMPGRLIGKTIDSAGEMAYRLALQTREQHIRLDKATSNVCTSQVLLANIAACYGVWHRKDGLQAIAKRVHALAQTFTGQMAELGIPTLNATDFFDTVTVKVSPASPVEVSEALQLKNMNIRIQDASHISVSFDETHQEADLLALTEVLKEIIVDKYPETSRTPGKAATVDGMLPTALARTGPFLEQKIFNSITSETDMLRYLYTLQMKDLSLNNSMITLGSCTMKLNSTSSMMPCSWEEIANIHPFAPTSTVQGYREMLHQLEQYLCDITDFDGCSLQPTSGASGEYAGLLAIRKYQESIGEGHRKVCIIPKSAHGTNPASAAMAGMDIKWVDDSNGMDMTELKKTCEMYKDDLSCLMVTYPSTHGVFEENIQEICQMIHDHGGDVYMDGANMNAQLGLTSPGMIGADVCHLNLHKTFSIPHGGGGPGMGPICVKKHLTPFLPNHCVVSPPSGGRLGAVSAAPWGQAGIACIPYMFTVMLGAQGITDSARYAILNANYMRSRLKDAYTCLSKNKNHRCSHEFIIDVSGLRSKTGISEVDIAKRLQDYGFHAPTMSWPVHNSLMIEPTESENKDELDRFCDAMLLIREEIRKVETGEWDPEDNPLKNAPHTQKKVISSEWPHKYTREEAAFPAPWVHQRGKFWPTCGRVSDTYGDRNLVLTHVA